MNDAPDDDKDLSLSSIGVAIVKRITSIMALNADFGGFFVFATNNALVVDVRRYVNCHEDANIFVASVRTSMVEEMPCDKMRNTLECIVKTVDK